MNSRHFSLLGLGTVLSLLLTSCVQVVADSGPSFESVQSAIVAVGYPCASVVNSTEFINGQTIWRVSCQDALVYTAQLSDDEKLCITPMPYVDFPSQFGPTGLMMPTVDERCIAGDQLGRFTR